MTTAMAAVWSRQSDEWVTPPELFQDLAYAYGPFDLDPAAQPDTAQAPRFYTPVEDGLAQPWDGVVWLNPPYSQVGLWVAKAVREVASGAATRVVCLVGARTDTRWWHEFVPRATEVVLLKGRVRFCTPAGDRRQSAPFPSAVLVFQRDVRLNGPRWLSMPAGGGPRTPLAPGVPAWS